MNSHVTERLATSPQSPTPIATAAPTLQDLAESERSDEVAVNVSDAVKALRVSARAAKVESTEHADSVGAPTSSNADPEAAARRVDAPQVSESDTIKEKMVRASRARRKQRPDLVTEAIDPVLPDWYEPDLDETDGATRSKGKSVSRG